MQKEFFWGTVLVYFSCYFFKERVEKVTVIPMGVIWIIYYGIHKPHMSISPCLFI